METYTKSNPYSFLSPMGREIRLWEDNGNYWVSIDGVSYDADEARYQKYLTSGYEINRKTYPEIAENPFR